MALAVQAGVRAAGILVNLARAQAAYDRFNNVRDAVADLRRRANMWGGARAVRKMPYKSKRAKSANEEAHNKLSGSTIAVGQAAQYTQSTSKYGRKVGSYGPKALARMVKLSLQSAIYRFQSLTSLITHVPGEFSQPLQVKCNVVAGNTETIDLPMYCFNLSSNPSQAPGTVIRPFYRARKLTPLGVGLSTGVPNYGWTMASGVSNTVDGALSLAWQLEECKDPPTVAAEYRHDWSSIDLLFNCAKHNPCTIHVALVKFKNEVGPNRMYFKEGLPASTSWDDVLDPASIEQSEIDVFWESFWAPRIVHPLSSFKNPVKRNYIEFIKHEKIVVNDNGQSFEGGSGIPENPTMHLKKLFYNNGRNFNNTTAKASDTQVAGDIIPPVQGNPAGVFGTKSYGFNTITREMETSIYPDRDKDTWLLVWADHFPDPSGDILNPSLKHCTFDFKIRSKFTQMV